ncbi:synaptobrevin homolog YKT6-like [Ctenocephalides felis]|uniref:synaptobrevin homolog YKT6-like n=1 Tax=Ctenocephalides felis TaxID=7515 RepID=UPI000E6E39F7|nr:synaptobrevin homolog YKT6-like [Ctenocephalides felis]
MVKLYSASILYKGSTSVSLLKSVYELQSFSFFQRGSVQEFLGFVSQTIVERTQAAARQSVKENEYTCHVYVRGDGLAGVVVSDHEYPSRVAHTMITKILDEFAGKISPESWQKGPEACSIYPVNVLAAHLTHWQNPKEADAMTRIQEDLDETKIILHNTLGAVLERGEKLDDLVNKSEMLSIQSKAFYKTAKKTNSCCSYS